MEPSKNHEFLSNKLLMCTWSWTVVSIRVNGDMGSFWMVFYWSIHMSFWNKPLVPLELELFGHRLEVNKETKDPFKDLPLWRKAQEKLEKNHQTLRTDQYRDVCGEILHLNRNWRTGCSTKFTYPVVEELYFVTISDEYVSWNCRFGNYERRNRCAFLDTQSIGCVFLFH